MYVISQGKSSVVGLRGIIELLQKKKNLSGVIEK